MSSEQLPVFTREVLDVYMKELGKQFRKLNGIKFPAEIILVGGAAILANYNFRQSTSDIDAIIYASSAMKEAIVGVGNKFGLPKGWINTDFTKTSTYTDELIRISAHYRTYSNILQVRTVSAQYLVAMKLKAARKYKSDFSDIIGIIYEHNKMKKPLKLDDIREAVIQLYGSWDCISETSIKFIEKIFMNGNYEEIYEEIINEERVSRDTLVDFEQEYPRILSESNVEEILQSLKNKL